MPSSPRFSVLINNFNYAPFLEAAVSSALNQTQAPHEVVVVDDGSTDDSLTVLGRYPQVKVLRQPNSGQGAAIRNGVAAVSGDIVCLLDADDVWHPEKLETLARHLPSLPPDWTYLRHNLEVIGIHKEAPGGRLSPNIKAYEVRACLVAQDVLAERRNAPTSAICAPRKALQAVTSLYPIDLFRVSADAVLYSFLPLLGPSVSLQDVLGSYRIHGGNAYFGRRSLQDIEGQMRLELRLLDLAGPQARFGDTLLETAHRLRSTSPTYLDSLGSLRQRLRKTWGHSGTRSSVASRGRAVARELRRTFA